MQDTKTKKEVEVENERPSTALTVHEERGGWMIPGSYDDLDRVSSYYRSAPSMLPKHFQEHPEAIPLAIMAGAEVGLSPFRSITNISVINGMPALFGDAPLAIVRASPKFYDIDEGYLRDKDDLIIGAYCKTKRVRPDGTITDWRETTFTIQDAVNAGLWQKAGPWKTYAQRMLMFRARGWNLRDNFGDVLMGIGIGEELRDLEFIQEAEAEIIDDETPKPRDAREKVIEKSKEVEQGKTEEEPEEEETAEPEEKEPEADPKQEYIVKIVEQFAALGVQPDKDKDLVRSYATQACATKVTTLDKLSITALAQLYAVNDALMDEAGESKDAAITAMMEIGDTMKPIQDPNEARAVVKSILEAANPKEDQGELGV